MKKKLQFFGLLVAAIFFTGCEPDISFTEPQPESKSEESKFKSKFRGNYLCVEDSSVLVVDKISITQKWHFDVEANQDSILNFKQSIGNFKMKKGDDDLVIKSNEDSTQYTIDYNKTLFSVSNTNVLKYEKGIYFLNSKKKGSTWDVKILHFNKEGHLLLMDLNLNKEDLEKLKSITEVEVEKNVDGDITEYKLQPTRKELREILDSGFFEEGEEFVRLR